MVGGLFGVLPITLLHALSLGRWFRDERIFAVPIGIGAGVGLAAGVKSGVCRRARY